MREGGIFFSTTLLKPLIVPAVELHHMQFILMATSSLINIKQLEGKFLLGSTVFILSPLCACNIE